MEFIDLKKQNHLIKKEIDSAIHNVINHGKFINGPEVEILENNLKQLIGAKFCSTVSSGTDALLIALMAIDIIPGDEIITSPFSFVSAVEVISLLGCKPIFVDINPNTFNIDVSKIEEKITKKTKAIIPVSMFGQCCDMDKINDISKRYKLFVIEDGAQSFGSKYKENFSCNLSTIGCTSFFPTKPLGCYGDGGACFTNDSIIAEKIKKIKLHGIHKNKKFYHDIVGINGRLDTIQAAILIEKLKIFSNEIILRNKIANNYDNLILQKNIPVSKPFIEEYNQSAYAQYTIKTMKRDQLRDFFKTKGIPTISYYPLSLNKLPYLFNKENCNNSEKIVDEVLSLPMHPYLSIHDQENIVNELNNFFVKTS